MRDFRHLPTVFSFSAVLNKPTLYCCARSRGSDPLKYRAMRSANLLNFSRQLLIRPVLSLAESWQRILDNLQSQADSQGKLDWDLHYVDGTIVRAHQQAAGAKGSRAEAEAWGRSQGGFSTKIYVRADGHGKPLTCVLTAGQRHETVAFEKLMTQLAVHRPGRGRPHQRPRRPVADKGYSSRQIRASLRRREIRQTIPHKTNEHPIGPFNRAIYRSRNLVERFINRLKQYRRIATPYEKRADNYLAILLLAPILFCL